MTSGAPRLYGLTDANTNRTGRDLWGKNQFNSTFPIALCLKMRNDGISPVYVRLGPELDIQNTTEILSMEKVLGSEKDDMYYRFESIFDPYSAFVGNYLEKIDLVVLKSGRPLHPLEVKLTVVPDSTTAVDEEAGWGPEMVVRPVSSAYAMMGIARQLRCSENQILLKQVEAALKPVYSDISGWNNVVEIVNKRDDLTGALSDAMEVAREVQEPYLLQPIWRTEGQSLKFCRRCFDVFIWSDAAIMAIPLERLLKKRKDERPSRHLREIARHVKAFYEACTLGHFNYHDTYGGMPLDNQTDKSFSVSGKVTRTYLKHARLIDPHYSAEVLSELILNGGQRMLKPERRFDAAVVAQF